MRFGITLPNVGVGGGPPGRPAPPPPPTGGVGEDPRVLADLASDAEEAGWDGVFVWDAPYVTVDDPVVRVTHEAWAVLATMAVRTERVLLGTMITPLPWRQPWLVARQALTLDRLSGGRFVLSVGLGAPPTDGPTPFGETADRRERARRLDEGLDVLRGLWSGERFSYGGEFDTVRDVLFLPPPLGRIPVWVVGAWHRDPEAWPRKRSLRRALAWDGVLPNIFDRDGVSFEASPEDLRPMVEWIRAQRDGPFDVVFEGGSQTDENTPVDEVRAWRDAGATWWLEPVWWAMYRHPGDAGPMRERVRSGPPRL